MVSGIINDRINSSKPTTYQGKILVPFAIESALSGVKKQL